MVNTENPVVRLEVRTVTFMRNENTILKEVDFSLQSGDLFQIDGANGSGKSTLLRILAGLLPPTEGEIRWQENDRPLSSRQIRRDLTYLGHKNAIKDDLTPLENLEYIMLMKNHDGSMSPLDALQTFNLQHKRHTPTGRLSAGQRRKIALGRLLVCSTRYWLLDEPFTALDQEGKGILESIIKQHVNGGGMVVFATHQAMEIEGADVQHVHLAPS